MCLEYTVTDTLQFLLHSQCHIRRRYSSRRKVILKASEYHQIDRTATTCSSFKPDARMFRWFRNIRTGSSLLVDWRTQLPPQVPCPVFFAWIFCFIFSCVGGFRLSKNTRTLSCTASTLLSAHLKCFWTFFASSEGEILYVLEPL